MGGGGAKTSGGSTSAASGLEQIAQQFFQESTPLRTGLIGQFEEALETGGIGARLPVVQRAEEASRRATSTAMSGVERQLAQTGLAGTPFGERISAETRAGGEYATSQIGPSMVMQFLSQLPGFVTGTGQTIVSGMGGAAGAQAQTQAAATSGFYDLMSAMMGAGGQAGAAWAS